MVFCTECLPFLKAISNLKSSTREVTSMTGTGISGTSELPHSRGRCLSLYTSDCALFLDKHMFSMDVSKDLNRGVIKSLGDLMLLVQVNLICRLDLVSRQTESPPGTKYCSL